MAATSDAIVIGAGIAGASTALALRRRGLEVTLIDAHEPGHARAASAGDHRILRASHGSDELYTALEPGSAPALDGARNAGRPGAVRPERRGHARSHRTHSMGGRIASDPRPAGDPEFCPRRGRTTLAPAADRSARDRIWPVGARVRIRVRAPRPAGDRGAVRSSRRGSAARRCRHRRARAPAGRRPADRSGRRGVRVRRLDGRALPPHTWPAARGLPPGRDHGRAAGRLRRLRRGQLPGLDRSWISRLRDPGCRRLRLQGGDRVARGQRRHRPRRPARVR